MDNGLMFLFGAIVGVGITGLTMLYYLSNGFRKDKTTPEQPDEYNEHNLPKGCELIQMGDKYVFKIKGKFAGMNHEEYYLWSNPSCVQQYCMTKDKQYAIKRGIETFTFFKALGKI